MRTPTQELLTKISALIRYKKAAPGEAAFHIKTGGNLDKLISCGYTESKKRALPISG